MMRILIYLANIIILCSTPFITPYLIPHYSVVIAIFLVLLYVGEKGMHIGYSKDLWTKTIINCIVSFDFVLVSTATVLFFKAKNKKQLIILILIVSAGMALNVVSGLV